MRRLTKPDIAARGIIYFLLTLLAFATLYPFWNSFVVSVNSAGDTARGGLTLWPREFTLDNYIVILKNSDLFRSFFITVLRTVSGTVLSILATSIFAFGMSRKGVIGKKFYMTMCVVTMYFSGGLIPYYLLILNLKMNNTFWVLIIPGMISVFHMIVFRAFFMGIPESLIESAKMDGCNYLQIYYRIVLPVSGAVIAALSLFQAVSLWNDWFFPSIFISERKLMPIQSLLNQIIAINAAEEMMGKMSRAVRSEWETKGTISARSLIATAMMIVTLPIIIVYPFLQKHFVKGVLIGSLKE